MDLGESFPTHIYLQNLASIQPRTSPVKFVRSPRTDPPGGVRNADAPDELGLRDDPSLSRLPHPHGTRPQGHVVYRRPEGTALPAFPAPRSVANGEVNTTTKTLIEYV